jgi:hypothetical protein
METLFEGSLRIGESRGDSQDAPSFEIRPTTGWLSLDLRELWTYRELNTLTHGGTSRRAMSTGSC